MRIYVKHSYIMFNVSMYLIGTSLRYVVLNIDLTLSECRVSGYSGLEDLTFGPNLFSGAQIKLNSTRPRLSIFSTLKTTAVVKRADAEVSVSSTARPPVVRWHQAGVGW